MSSLWALAPDGIGEVTRGTDLAALVLDHVEVEDGDVVVLTSKIVSKAEDRVIEGSRDDALASETVRVVARRGPTTIVENHLGLVMAAAGIDASNVASGRLVLLPRDPDASARRVRDEIEERTGHNVAVVVSDTAGRPWRQGQTDIAIGVAGLDPLQEFAGQQDAYGNDLVVTAPAIADEVAAVAELVSTKKSGRPLTVVRGLAARVLPPGGHGPGARALLRPARDDMFALGTREAVEAALRGESHLFGSPATPEDFVAALHRCDIPASVDDAGVTLDAVDLRADILAAAHGWRRMDGSSRFQRSL